MSAEHEPRAGGVICGCTWGWWNDDECVCSLPPGHVGAHGCACGEEWEYAEESVT